MSSEQIVKEETSELNAIIDKMHLPDTYRIFHTTATEYTLLSTTHRTFSKIDHPLGHKTSLKKVQ
jgi:exonuclease III